ncbi:hypothetical protein HF086_012027 [Spodoptera exigua]|uniref:Uncharacterized protein n=1 Tax=Spodoptera exigua TaxID=7107 RepID=A0A922SHJ7_SPOEX|nr:hypothetical protein HF086_012027 [Spodoptera exigua]
MKYFVIIAVLSVLIDCYEAFVLLDRQMKLSEGFTIVYDDTVNGTIMSNAEVIARNDGWRLLYEVECTSPAVVGRVKNSYMTYRGPANTVIGRITVTPDNQPANVYHSALGTNNLEVRLMSNISQGIQATVRLYQRSGAGKAFGEPAFHLMFFVLLYFGISTFT